MTPAFRIAMWSGPRNISTAMMRAWENRADTTVSDEPLYAHYLVATGAPHPGRDEVIAAQETDWRKVVRELCGPVPGGKAVWYQKHMAQHATREIGLDWLDGVTNVFLIRDPDEVVASFAKRRENPELWELGYQRQAQLFDFVAQRTGEVPAVVDARDILEDPETMLRGLCARVGVAFSERMLRWPAGPRASDGVWARYWYDAVRRSTGFARYRPGAVRLTPAQQRLAASCRTPYEQLRRHSFVPRRDMLEGEYSPGTGA